MKKLSFLLMLCIMLLSSQQMLADGSTTLVVTRDYNSRIENANYIGWSDDGSMLGFYYSSYYDEVYFVGTSTYNNKLEVPENVSINGYSYPVIYCGYSASYSIDIDESPYLTELTLPSTITDIFSEIPSQISDIHLKSPTRPFLFNYLPSDITVWVSKDAYPSYIQFSTSLVNDRYWCVANIHYEGWVPNAITVTINTPGTFAQVLQNQIEDPTEIDELTVIGKLNDSDMAYFSRLKSMTKLDLSQTDIKSIRDCENFVLLKKVLLPTTVEEIPDRAFANCFSLTDINLANIKVIGEEAFENNVSLSNINLPRVTTIGKSAFRDCDRLENISIPIATSIGSYAFVNCNSLREITLPEITSLSYGVFEYCSNLTSINCPKVSNIGNFVFERCTSLTTLNLPVVEKIGAYAFANCSNLSHVDIPSVYTLDRQAFAGCSNLTSVNLPNTTELGTDVFSNCENLHNVTLGITNVEAKAFYDCTSLTSINIPATTCIGDSAFMNCNNLTEINFPLVKNIGNYSFRDCNNLTDVSLPNVVSIGEDAFCSCDNLTAVDLPLVTKIGTYAFYRCEKLMSANIPNIKEIGSVAFGWCNLSNITLPGTLQSLKYNAFYGNTNLKDVYCYVASPFDVAAFGNNTATLHVPAFSLNAYIANLNWKGFYKIVPMDGNVDKINIV